MRADEPVVGLLEATWDAIVVLGRGFDDTEWAMPSECPGWDTKDLVSHMVGTERSLLGDPAPPGAEPAPHVRNDLGARNEAWVAERRDRPGAEVLSEFEEVTARRRAALAAMDGSGFDTPGPTPVGQAPYREFMAVRVMDCWVHEQDMRIATGRPGRYDGEESALALGRIESAMPFVVGKKAGAPDGVAVRFVVLGDASRQLDVVVSGGRAAFGPTDDPAVVLTMETATFWRLACGRIAGDPALAAGLVDITGDEDPGGRVVRDMAFMI